MNGSFPINIVPVLRGTALKRGAIFGLILITALLAFEVFNFSTTAFALNDILGDLKSGGIQWSTILAIAFCGIDFAGIARIITPQHGRDEPTEVWYLFGAWLLAAGFNAALTWWGVSIAILRHNSAGSILIGESTLVKVVPVFVAVMVWMIRVLIIGTFSLAGENMFTLADVRPGSRPGMRWSSRPTSSVTNAPSIRPAPKPAPTYGTTRAINTIEPTYHPVGIGAESYHENPSVRS